MRKNANYAQAKEFVTGSKQQKIRTTAELWLAANETDPQPRFDVVEVYAPEGENTANPVINHLIDAF